MKNSIKIKEIIIATLLVFCVVIKISAQSNTQVTTLDQPGTSSSSFGINFNNSNFQGLLKLEGSQKGKYAGLFYNEDNGSANSGETRFGIGIGGENNSWKEVFNIYPNGDLVVGGEGAVHNSSNGLPSLSVAGDIFSVSGSFISNSGFIGTNNGDIFTVSGSIGGPKLSIGFEGEESLKHGQIQIDNKEINRKIILFENQDNDHEFSGFGINPNILRYQVGSTAFNHVFYAGNSATNSDELMRIKGDGNVGIGTSNPSSKLAVNGTVTALDYALVSATNMPDYVFASDYKLPSLKETEQFIKINKHLSYFKSAKEMQSTGYGLIDMDKSLLQTVEELTLHAIAQEKEINSLKSELKLHDIIKEKEISSMKNELAEIKALLLAKK